MSNMALYTDLKNQKILVTGASRGIGRAIAEHLAAQGAYVLFNYRGDELKARELENTLIQLGAGGAKGLAFDVTDFKAMKEQVDMVCKELGPITGLVNNAGISKDTLLLRLKEDELGQILDTNLKSAIMLTSYLSRYMLKAPASSIVNISSIVGLMGNAAQTAYAASKAGLIGATKSVAKELASKNIRCNAVCPGFIETDMTNQLDDKVKEAYLSTIPLKRLGTSQEVAQLTAFLLSNASGYITGEVLKIDGGLYI
jgi:3-oxoacyl-[acyl-carrier protein] reductase